MQESNLVSILIVLLAGSQLTLFILKFTQRLDWSWYLILIPVWIPLILVGLAFVFAVTIRIAVYLFTSK